MLSDSYYLIAIQLFSMFGCVWQPLINEHDDDDVSFNFPENNLCPTATKYTGD